ncbi:hypothetical protein [Pseudomonas putida]|uniref:hypothetical protein n=1 Tax=Pseudomonas putida TaxID=303 RepID=UPI001E2F8CD4|nr:hypothetical protein [Pseudomonas putida]MCE0882888.1 hypothetical protein [Pseudomonas putida]MCE0962829.1 hypothetical protein [Pseudomonas putida]
MLVDIRETGLSGMDFSWRLYRETGVSVLDAQAFGESSKGFIRVSFAVADDDLKEACSRIKRFVEGLANNR